MFLPRKLQTLRRTANARFNFASKSLTQISKKDLDDQRMNYARPGDEMFKDNEYILRVKTHSLS